MRNQVIALLAVAALFGAALAPAAAAADTADESLAVTVTQDDDVTVEVTRNGSAVENATVTVAAVDGSYDGSGSYETDADGTVALPTPDERVNVTVTASDDDETAATTVELDPDFEVDVEQNRDVVVTVTRDDAAVENATVNVSTRETNSDYDGAGSYETGENGTVVLPTPEGDEAMTLTVTDGETVERNVTLVDGIDVSAAQNDDGTVTVDVTRNDTAIENANVSVSTDGNATYEGTGDYQTDADGEVSLVAPDENVTVSVNASADNASDATTVELEYVNETAQEDREFAGVSDFVHYLLENGSTGIGPEVSEYVTQNNPGNAPDHAGPPEDRGADEDDEEVTEDEEETDDEETEDEEETDDEETEDEEETDDEETDDDGGENGLPDHANGNAKGR
ncbi:DNA primase [Haloarcula sp. JP-L23]|uniref:DNA primase n=1 Tax=Haloarcula sp. JP-L23 TaxID=2716717 RepID=UPI00140EB890|nr:DNA primase [Haloarcula sp. JP-L23]